MTGSEHLFDAFAGRVKADGLQLCGAAVQQHGVLLGEYRWTEDVPHHIFSLSKSYTGILTGIAVDDGIISLSDSPVGILCPELKGQDERLDRMTLGDLLIMASGHAHAYLSIYQRHKITEKDWVRYFLSKPMAFEPGTVFRYDTGCTYVIGAMLSRVTGQRLNDFAMERLFRPLGMTEKPRWDECPMGNALGGTGLYLKTRDILDLGQLCLDGGVRDGKRIVSEEWIRESTRAHIASENRGSSEPQPDYECGYGYQFWMDRNGSFRGDGYRSQFCIVDPALDAVIALTADEQESQKVLNAVWDTLYPVLKAVY